MPDEDEDTLDPTAPPAPPAPSAPPVPGAGAAPPVPPAPPTPAAPRSPVPDLKAVKEDYRLRGQKSAFKSLLGVEDEQAARTTLDELRRKAEERDALLAAEEQRKREQMTEVDRLKEDLQKITAERDELKRQLESVQRDKVAFEQDAKIRSIAVNFIAPKWLKYAMGEFRDYVMGLSKTQQAALNEQTTTRWFQKLAKDNEVVALERSAPPPSPAPTDAAPKPPATGIPPIPRRVPAGARPPGPPSPARPPASPDPLAGKTPRPGLPNSMNREELALYAKQQNIRLP